MGEAVRGRPRKRIEVEATVILSLPDMIRSGRIQVGARTVRDIEWGPVDAPPVAAVRLTAEMGLEAWHLVLRHPGGESYVVDVVSVPQPFGGRRWRLVCPVLGVRTVSLYLPTGAGRFASRQAHGLGYRSQRLDARGRAGEREAKVRTALGGSGRLDEAFPDRPKGMRHATYQRHRARAGAG